MSVNPNKNTYVIYSDFFHFSNLWNSLKGVILLLFLSVPRYLLRASFGFWCKIRYSVMKKCRLSSHGIILTNLLLVRFVFERIEFSSKIRWEHIFISSYMVHFVFKLLEYKTGYSCFLLLDFKRSTLTYRGIRWTTTMEKKPRHNVGTFPP